MGRLSGRLDCVQGKERPKDSSTYPAGQSLFGQFLVLPRRAGAGGDSCLDYAAEGVQQVIAALAVDPFVETDVSDEALLNRADEGVCGLLRLPMVVVDEESARLPA